MRKPAIDTVPPAVTLDAYPFRQLVTELHAKFLNHRDGAVATYIPELAKADPNLFGIAVVTGDGFIYQIGDSDHPFTIQSISKPIVYGIALEDHGRETVVGRIGVEPSGDPFNSIAFDERNNRPFNPMVNAGAIAATSLIKGASRDARQARMMSVFERFVGHPVSIDKSVYRSELSTGHRNRAIAYLELNAGMLHGDPDEHLDLYFRQCSILTSARDLALMAATLANDGLNPCTGQRAMASETVRDVLSVMATCGMYDYAGAWQFNVGLPAKSGVAGGIMAVLPGQLGIGVFSPLLDAIGNSARGIMVCEELSRHLRLHLLDYRGAAWTVLRRVFRVADVRSKRVRRPTEAQLLDRLGERILVYELQGDLSFANLEKITRRVQDDSPSGTHFVLDLGRIAWIDPVADELLGRLGHILSAQGKRLVLAGVHAAGRADAFRLTIDGVPARSFPEVDAALEFCEDEVLARHGGHVGGNQATVVPHDMELLAGFSEHDFALLDAHLTRERYAKGEYILREGEVSDGLFLLTRGQVDVSVSVNGSEQHRVGTVDAGNMFGELAIFYGGTRTADVIATSDVECLVLRNAALEALATEDPILYAKLLKSVGKSLSDRLRRANTEIKALAS
ncbi:MAG: glutaminase A [Alphaproteobacteria bacterium]